MALISLVLGVGLIWLWPTGELDLDLSTIGFADEVIRGEVVSATAQPCSYAADLDCNGYEVELLEEPAGVVIFLEFPDEPGQPDLSVGEIVFVSVVEFEDGSIDFQFAGKDRVRLLLGVGFIFGLAVVGLGRLRGLAALAALSLSVGVLIWFILPAILHGSDAVLVAIVGGGVIALVSLYLAHGPGPLTHVAAIGSFSALLLTALLSWGVIELARFTGVTGDESFVLLAVSGLDLTGLLLAGIVLGAIGALDDVTVTQASAVMEVGRADPDLGAADLYRAGIRVGRDHIVSTVNTLLLAYAGASLPLLIFFSVSSQSFGFIASTEIVATEIVRTLVGSIGLVAAVPITTWLSARAVFRLNSGGSPTRVSP